MARRWAIALLLAAMTCGVAAAAEDLVLNPGFEQGGAATVPAEWQASPKVYSRDATVHHSGEAALKYVNSDPSVYVLCSRPIALTKGKMYELSAWVKTQDVAGKESGATICIEYHDKDGKYVGGNYPEGVKGTADWTLVHSITERIPENADGCSISCYVRPEMTGTAWWDDVSVVPYKEPPLSSILASPNYRNQVLGPNPDPIRVRCFMALRDYEIPASDLLLQWRVLNAADKSVVANGETGPLAGETADVMIDAKGLADGRYLVEVTLKPKAGGDAMGTETWPITRIAETPKRTAYIDAHNRLILNGEPFFPLGMYWGGVKPEELDIYAQSAFNCLMPYGAPSKEEMDQIQAHGLKVIYTVKDLYFGTVSTPPSVRSLDDEYTCTKAAVEQFRDHPALLAWYVNDEFPLSMLDRLSQHRQWIEDLDPNHPAWVVLYQVDQVRQYVTSYDVIGTDPYPIPERGAALAGTWARKMTEALGGSRAMWQVPQVFNWANYRQAEAEKAKCRAPTFDEMRSMAWQSIVEGATGIVFYSWFDIRKDPATPFDEQWEKVKKVAKEIKDMSPVLLSIETPPQIEIAKESWLNAATRQSQGTTYIILANNTGEAHTARVAMPAPPVSITDRADGSALAASASIEVPIAPLGVRILQARW